jgi:hypothetical protein
MIYGTSTDSSSDVTSELLIDIDLSTVTLCGWVVVQLKLGYFCSS